MSEASATPRRRAPRGLAAKLGAVVLGFEAVVVGLGGLTVFGLRALPEGIEPWWAIVGGGLLVLTVFGDRVFRLGGSSDAGIGILYAARGIGATVGSFTVTAIARASKTMRNLEWFEVEQIRGHIKDGEVAHYQVVMKVGFRIDD